MYELSWFQSDGACFMEFISNVAEKAKDLTFFRELAARLQQLPDSDWTEWEWEWLGEMARKPASYEPSERERLKLAQINSYAELFSDYDGLSVEAMVNTCHRFHLDFRRMTANSSLISIDAKPARSESGSYVVSSGCALRAAKVSRWLRPTLTRSGRKMEYEGDQSTTDFRPFSSCLSEALDFASIAQSLWPRCDSPIEIELGIKITKTLRVTPLS
jgi:hypothetical protein